MKKLLILNIYSLSIALTTLGQQSTGYLDGWKKPNGPVYALAKSGNTLYLGGTFTKFSWRNAYGAALDTGTGEPSFIYHGINGIVNTCVPDGAGGWYIGGEFSQVAGQIRNHAARLNADGSLHPWNPDVNSGVDVLVRSGNTVYIGGTFTGIGGTYRMRLGAVDATTGNLLSWNPTPNNSIRSMTISSGIIYIGGSFTTVGGQPRVKLAAIDSATGNVTPLIADVPQNGGYVASLVVSGNTLFVGGYFTTLGGQPRNSLGAIDISSGSVKPWNPSITRFPSGLGTVDGMVMANDKLFIAGSFDYIGTVNKESIGAVDTATGLATSWNAPLASPNYTYSANCIDYSGGRIYAGGRGAFPSNNNPNLLVKVFDANTAAIIPWQGSVNGIVNCIRANGSSVYVGGEFTAVDESLAKNLAAIDLSTGKLKPWVSANSSVYSMKLEGNTIYFGGSFTQVGNIARTYLAAADTNGILSTWNPVLQGSSGSSYTYVNDIALNGAVLFASGNFTSVGALPRNSLAAIDISTGSPTSWNPLTSGFSGGIICLALSGNNVFIAGGFTTIMGQTRTHAAALDATTGALKPWNPNIDRTVYDIQIKDSILYLGGNFSTVGGLSRKKLAAVDSVSGTPYPWTAQVLGLPTIAVASVSLSEHTLYAGGNFSIISGQNRNGLAAFDLNTGLSSWDPNAGGSINVVLAAGDTIFAGGSFTTMADDTTRRNFIPLIDSNNLPGMAITTIDPPNNICRGTSIAISFTAPPKNPGNIFKAQLSNSIGNFATAIDIGTLSSATSGLINAVIPAGGTGGTQYRIRVVSTSPADTTDDNGYGLAINSLPAITQATISPTSQPVLCTGDTFTMSVPLTAGCSYQWNNNVGPISGATNSTYQATVSGNYTATVTNSSGCSRTSANKNVTITQLSSSFTINTLTNGNKKLLSSEPQAQYQWYLNGTLISGATSQTYLATISGSYHVVVTKAGCTVTGTPVSVTISPLNIIGLLPSNNFCKGANVAITFTASGITAGNVFTAQLSDTSGSFANPYTIGTLVSTTGGTINAIITDTASLGSHYRIRVVSSNPVRISPDNGYNITLQPKPTTAQIAITPTGAQAICSGSSVLLQVPNTPGYTYQWKLDSIPIPYANANSFPASLAGSYTVAVTTQYGCVRSSVDKTVTIKALPSAAFTITQLANGNKKLTATEALATYQWYMNTVAISGASQKNYTATVNGDYYVAVTKNGCTATGTPAAVIVGSAKPSGTVAATVGSQTTLAVYPNPSSGTSNILIRSDKETSFTVIISDITGRKVRQLQLVTDRSVSFGDDLAPGVYTIEAIGNEGNLISKWVKQ